MRGALFASIVVVVVLAGLALRFVEADAKSLWLDELHTLEIGRSGDVGTVIDRLRPDFHAPLHFFAVHLMGDLNPHRMRLVSTAIGLLALLPLLALAKDGGIGGPGRLAMAAAFLLLPFQIRYGVDLRPYAWLQLFVTLALWAAFSRQGTQTTRLIVFAIATAAGLYTHYSMSIVVIGIGAARLFIHGNGLLPLVKVIVAGTIGAAAFLPWVYEVERWVFEDPGVMTRDEKATEETGEPTPNDVKPLSEFAVEVAPIPIRLATPSFNQLGAVQGKVVMAGAGLLGLVLAYALFVSMKRASTGTDTNRTWWGALLAAGMILAVMLLVVWRVWGRPEVRYFIIVAWAWPMIIGGLVHGAARRGKGQVVLLATVLALLVAGSGHAFGNPREDLRAGVEKIRSLLEEDPSAITTAILRQPDWYHHTSIYSAYAPELAVVEPMEVGAPGPDMPERVLVVTRNASPRQAGTSRKLWTAVSAGRTLVDTIIIDRATVVYVYDVN